MLPVLNGGSASLSGTLKRPRGRPVGLEEAHNQLAEYGSGKPAHERQEA